MRQNPHVRICGGPGSATTLVYPTPCTPQGAYGARHWPTRTTSARHRIRHGTRHTAARTGRRPCPYVANGESLRARSPAGQGSEVVRGCEILNRMTALGRPVSYRIGR